MPTTEDDIAVPDELLSRVGHLTRTLHDNLRELGYDQAIQNAAQEIPDVRDRLNYVVNMTDQAAQRVLNAIDRAIPLQETISKDASVLANDWQSLLKQPFDEAAYRKMADSTVCYLGEACTNTDATKQQLMEIMMAQDFQDLTGQVIRKVTDIAHNLEHQLVKLLLEYAPAEIKREKNSGLLNGPQIDPAQEGVVSNQTQVDDLLDSLGF
ncbi:protein phosphatase CheZ [Sulfuriferula sp. AH1]|nr:protein phosphatase CheZ [Sulfuriferula sp. AH1]